eukprot:16442254-Heterocapsa_arctica.AAC.1
MVPTVNRIVNFVGMALPKAFPEPVGRPLAVMPPPPAPSGEQQAVRESETKRAKAKGARVEGIKRG